jgi:hypothetical protein
VNVYNPTYRGGSDGMSEVGGQLQAKTQDPI